MVNAVKLHYFLLFHVQNTAFEIRFEKKQALHSWLSTKIIGCPDKMTQLEENNGAMTVVVCEISFHYD